MAESALIVAGVACAFRQRHSTGRMAGGMAGGMAGRLAGRPSAAVPRTSAARLRGMVAVPPCRAGGSGREGETSGRLKDLIEKALVKDCGKYAGYETQIQDIARSVEDEKSKLYQAQNELSAKEEEIRMLRRELDKAKELKLDSRAYSMKLKWATDDGYRTKMVEVRVWIFSQSVEVTSSELACRPGSNAGREE